MMKMRRGGRWERPQQPCYSHWYQYRSARHQLPCCKHTNALSNPNHMIHIARYGYARTLYHVSVQTGKIQTDERCNVMYYY